MILGAGMGKRLGKITEVIPKVLVEINGKTILNLAVEKCTSSGFDDIIVNVHHFADMVEKEVARLNKTGFRIKISDERSGLLDTGGGLYKARNFFDKKPFLLYNADIITDLDISAFLAFHNHNSGLATLAVRNRPGNRYFLVNSMGLLRGWYNKSTGEKIITSGTTENLAEIAFSGLHIINPDIFDYMHGGIFSMTTLYLQLAKEHNIYTYKYDEGFWADIGTPESLNNIRNLFKNNPG